MLHLFSILFASVTFDCYSVCSCAQGQGSAGHRVGSGIGFEIATQLASHGAQVATMDRHRKILDKAAAVIVVLGRGGGAGEQIE